MNQELVQRYQDNYRAAASTIRFGKGISAFGSLLGVIGVFAGLIYAAKGCGKCGTWLFVGGIAVALALGIAGVALATLGRILHASLDTAAAANPTLSPHEQAQLMTMEG